MPSRRCVPLPTEDRDNLRFTYTPKSHRKFPWKLIALAFFLLIGISLLSLSYLIITNHMEGDGSQAYGLLFLGVLAFLPGLSIRATSVILYFLSILCLSGYYETRVAYYSWRRAPGYTFASIPDY